MPLSETAGAMECERITSIVPPAGRICFRGDKFPIQMGAGWHGFSALQVGRLHGVMNLGRNMDWLHAVAGLFVGLMVGMTGVGGGSLMAPILILLFGDRKSTRLNSSHSCASRMPSSA